MPKLHEFTVLDIDGNERHLAEFKDKAVLIVNVASKCGLTPQYEGLERLYEEFRNTGLEILAFPCNQFLEQEPGSEAEIKEFCVVEYGIRFPLFSKIEVNGEDRAPLYAWLTSSEVGPEESGDVKWNFGKFLIGRDGNLMGRFAPSVEPCSEELKASIQAVLDA